MSDSPSVPVVPGGSPPAPTPTEEQAKQIEAVMQSLRGAPATTLQVKVLTEKVNALETVAGSLHDRVTKLEALAARIEGMVPSETKGGKRGSFKDR
jgi:hypothetical protein